MNLIKIWNLTKLISLNEEPYLEKWARLFRYEQSLIIIKKQLKRNNQVRILDVGCGQDTLFFKYLEFNFPNDIKKIKYVGLDPLIPASFEKKSKHTIIKQTYEEYFSDTKDRYDIITLFAVLEHVDDPSDLLVVLSQLLSKGGYLVGTTPSNPAKPILEFLSFQMGMIARREIEEHKNYFNSKSINIIFNQVKSVCHSYYFYHQYFEFGLNNLFVIANI